MFKRVAIICLLSVALVGCGANSNTAQKNTTKGVHAGSPAVHKVTTESYQLLSKAEREKISFSFKAYQDATKASAKQTTYAPAPCNVDMTITNKTNKRVEFDQSKFLINELGDLTNSHLTGTITVKPNSSSKVAEIFANTSNQLYVADGLFEYLSADYPLAYTYLAIRDSGVSSSNLKSAEAIKINKDAQQQHADADNTTTDSDDATNDSSQEIPNLPKKGTPPGDDSNAEKAGFQITTLARFTHFAIAAWTNAPDNQSLDFSKLIFLVDGTQVPTPQSVSKMGTVVTNSPNASIGQFTFDNVFPEYGKYNRGDAHSLAIAYGSPDNIWWHWDGWFGLSLNEADERAGN